MDDDNGSHGNNVGIYFLDTLRVQELLDGCVLPGTLFISWLSIPVNS